jgi:hypothetical protein
MSYSPFFQTLYDESRPVGNFGRGTHYSVLRVPIWQDEWLNPLPQAALLDFAVLWDEDHDERVVQAVEEIYFAGLMGPVRFIGERKGSLNVLIHGNQASPWAQNALNSYREAVSRISNGLEDAWPATVDTVLGSEHSIVNAPRENVVGYLKNIDMLWQLGRKPCQRGVTSN